MRMAGWFCSAPGLSCYYTTVIPWRGPFKYDHFEGPATLTDETNTKWCILICENSTSLNPNSFNDKVIRLK